MGVTEAKKQYYLEQHTAQSLVSIIHANDWTEGVDLVNGGHIQMLVTEEEEGAVRADYEAASDAGLDVDPVSWLSKEEMLEVSVYEFAISIVTEFLTVFRSIVSRRRLARTQRLASQSA